MRFVMTEDLVAEVVRAIGRHPQVTSVTLVGSRSDNTATSLSDWDFVIDSPDARTVFADLPGIVARFEPLGAFWDPLADDHRNFIAIFPSLVTLDLHLDLPPPRHLPWEVRADTIAAIETHFWNWALWLKGKQIHARHELVASELVKMHSYLLGPLGCAAAPSSIEEAVTFFRTARSDVVRRLDVRPSDRRLEQEVLAAFRSDDDE